MNAVLSYSPANLRCDRSSAAASAMEDSDLHVVWTQAASAFTEFTVELDAFVAFVGVHEPADLGKLRADDAYLAVGCLQGQRAALRILERTVIEAARKAVAAIDASDDFVSEVLQQVRHRLLRGGPDGRPKLESFRARGSLAGWVSVVATRVALGERRKADGVARRNAELADALVETRTCDPELEQFRTRYGPQLQEAAMRAFGSLPSRSRTVLRMYLLEGVNIDAIGSVYGVHRATVARWIAKARDEVFERTAAEFREHEGIGRDQFASLSKLLVSQLDLDLSTLLRSSVDGSVALASLPGAVSP